MLHSSDTDEVRKHVQNINYDSPLSGGGKDIIINFIDPQHPQLQLKQNYHKFVDRSYRSGESGSTSGGKSMENIPYFKNQYYQRKKLNASNANEPGSMHSIQETYYPEKKRHTGNRNSRDQQFMDAGKYSC